MIWLMGLATRPGAGKGRKNGTVKALMPSCYTGRQKGIRTNLQGIDERSQMQSAFRCLVHANAHDSWQCSTFEGQICSLRKSFTSAPYSATRRVSLHAPSTAVG